MPAGLEVYDQFGGLRVSLGHRLLRFLGYVTVGAASGPGSLVNDGLLTGIPFAVPVMYSINGASYYPGDNMYPISVWFSGNVMYWTVNAGQPDQIIQYGVH